MEFALYPIEAPPWLEKIVFLRDGDDIKIEGIRRSGTQLFECRVSAVKFNQLADLLLTE